MQLVGLALRVSLEVFAIAATTDSKPTSRAIASRRRKGCFMVGWVDALTIWRKSSD
jgi:hypothetical protein